MALRPPNLAARHSCLQHTVVFFFFQAEDGIRDLTVTGVQTCALPIFPTPVNEPVLSYAPGTPERADLKRTLKELSGRQLEIPLVIGGKDVHTGRTVRSEERRVGKEGRSRWAPYH